MALRHVTQINYNGCFIAALAMLIGKTYDETYKLVFPDADPLTSEHAIKSEEHDGHNIGAAASRVMEKFGVKTKRSTYKQIKSLLKYAKKNTLIILRWGGPSGSMCHALVYDAETKQILDPSGPGDRTRSINWYQRNLDSMYYVEEKAA